MSSFLGSQISHDTQMDVRANVAVLWNFSKVQILGCNNWLNKNETLHVGCKCVFIRYVCLFTDSQHYLMDIKRLYHLSLCSLTWPAVVQLWSVQKAMRSWSWWLARVIKSLTPALLGAGKLCVQWDIFSLTVNANQIMTSHCIQIWQTWQHQRQSTAPPLHWTPVSTQS